MTKFISRPWQRQIPSLLPASLSMFPYFFAGMSRYSRADIAGTFQPMEPPYSSHPGHQVSSQFLPVDYISQQSGRSSDCAGVFERVPFMQLGQEIAGQQITGCNKRQCRIAPPKLALTRLHTPHESESLQQKNNWFDGQAGTRTLCQSEAEVQPHIFPGLGKFSWRVADILGAHGTNKWSTRHFEADAPGWSHGGRGRTGCVVRYPPPPCPQPNGSPGQRWRAGRREAAAAGGPSAAPGSAMHSSG